MVLASPLYYWSISGQLKTAFDRLFAVVESVPNYRIPPKQAALMMAADGRGFEEPVYWYEWVMKRMGWIDIGQILAGGVNKVGDIEGKPELGKAYARLSKKSRRCAALNFFEVAAVLLSGSPDGRIKTQKA